MQKTHLGADGCLDPALMSSFEDGAVDPFSQWHCAAADAGPPSPFDRSTIDPDLLALYPEPNGGVDLPAASSSPAHSSTPERCLSPPPPQEETGAIPGSPTTGIAVPSNMRDSPPTQRVRFATLPPRNTIPARLFLN